MKRILLGLLALLVLLAAVAEPAAAASRPGKKRPPRPNKRGLTAPAKVTTTAPTKVNICKYDPDTKTWKQLSVSSSAWKPEKGVGNNDLSCNLDLGGFRPCKKADCADPWIMITKVCPAGSTLGSDGVCKCSGTSTLVGDVCRCDAGSYGATGGNYPCEPCPSGWVLGLGFRV